jgi:hypothetical protein
MGYELQGKLSPAVPAEILLDRLSSRFASLGWTLARSEGSCYAFVYNEPSLKSFREDFMVCLEDGIYLLDHLAGPGDTTPRLKQAIEEALLPASVSITWVEI